MDTGYVQLRDEDFAAFQALIDQSLDITALRFADRVESNIPIYDMARLAPVLADPAARPALLGEWAHVLGASAGVVVLASAYADTAPIDAATRVYERIIERESADATGADHFAAAGSNARIWNSLQKLCMEDPDCFAQYFGNVAIAAVCEAWLGPNYQMTAQVNLVRPGGAAQTAHRDYHLGFQTADGAARYPAHQHAVTAALTLQGAVAHTDMPVTSGPTKLLPFSQTFHAGYLAFHDQAYRDLFESKYAQLPLAKGDAVFFNPALFHAAGANTTTDVNRMANLLQISSAFGRAMESIDRDSMALRLYPILKDMKMGAAETNAAIAACAEGYAFPTNLDTDPPTGGNAPESQADLMRRALDEGWETAAFAAALKDRSDRRRA